MGGKLPRLNMNFSICDSSFQSLPDIPVLFERWFTELRFQFQKHEFLHRISQERTLLWAELYSPQNPY